MMLSLLATDHREEAQGQNQQLSCGAEEACSCGLRETGKLAKRVYSIATLLEEVVD